MKTASTKEILYRILDRLLKLHPVGSCYTTSTNTNPSEWLGGTWVLKHKRFKSQWITTGFTFNTTNTSEGAVAARLNGNTITIRITWKNKVAISDNDTIIGTFNLNAMGISDGLHTVRLIGQGDALNAVCIGLANLAAGSNMNLVIQDWVTRATSYPTTTAASCAIEFTTTVSTSSMLDSFCDEFVWERTA